MTATPTTPATLRPASAPPRAHASTPIALANRRRSAWILGTLGVLIALVVLAATLDRPAFHAFYVGAGLAEDAAREARDRLVRRDWWQFLRALGYLPTWLALGAAMLIAHRRDAWSGASDLGPRGDGLIGLRLILSPALAGLIADLLKPTLGRVRPLLTDGQTVFLPFGPWRAAGEGLSFGLPSSHAAVAFGAAWTLTLWRPRLAWVTLPLAAGCAYTRLAHGAHFLTDTLAGAALAFAAAWLVRNR